MAQKALSRMALLHSNVCTPANVSSITVTGATEIINFDGDQLAYPYDRTRFLKTAPYAGATITVTINFSAPHSVSAVGLIGHNMGSVGAHAAVTFNGLLAAGATDVVAVGSLNGVDLDMGFVTETDTIDELQVVFSSGTSTGAIIRNIFIGQHTEMGKNPKDAAFRQSETAEIYKEYDIGGEPHVTFSAPYKEKSLEIEWRGGLSSDLKAFVTLEDHEWIGIISPLDHMEIPWSPDYNHHVFGFKKSVSSTPRSRHSATHKHDFVVTIEGV